MCVHVCVCERVSVWQYLLYSQLFCICEDQPFFYYNMAVSNFSIGDQFYDVNQMYLEGDPNQ